MAGTPPIKFNKAWVKSRIKAGWTVSDLAAHYSCHEKTVYKFIRAEGITLVLVRRKGNLLHRVKPAPPPPTSGPSPAAVRLAQFDPLMAECIRKRKEEMR